MDHSINDAVEKIGSWPRALECAARFRYTGVRLDLGDAATESGYTHEFLVSHLHPDSLRAWIDLKLSDNIERFLSCTKLPSSKV